MDVRIINRLVLCFDVDLNLEEGGKIAGGYIYEGADFYLGVKGVADGTKLIMNKDYYFKEVTSIGDRIIPAMWVSVDKVSKGEKVGAAIDISNTIANWIKNIYSYYSGK